MKFLVYFSRVFVGALLIVSGLVKANDVLGFSYKLSEYFEEGALNLTFLDPLGIPLSILVCVAEIVLAFAVLFGIKTKLATWCLMLLTIFFGVLTLYTATCDVHGTYQSEIIVDKNTPEYENLFFRSQNESTLSLKSEDGETAMFAEEKALQCVTDCGCFGDAMKGSLGRSLTPWESFYKDLILFVFVLPIFIWQKKIKINTQKEDVAILSGAVVLLVFFSWVFNWYFPVVFAFIVFLVYLIIKKLLGGEKAEWPIAIWSSVATLVFIYVTINHLPAKDYRPYAIGESIVENMKGCEELGLPCPVYANVYIMKNITTEEEFEVLSTDYMSKRMWEDKNLELKEALDKTVIVKEGVEPKVHDFNFTSFETDEDMTQSILEDELIFLSIAYELPKATKNKTLHNKLNQFAKDAKAEGVTFVGATSSDLKTLNEFKSEFDHPFTYYQADGIMLKTIVRSNPGVIALKKGVVVGKWHINDLPTYKESLEEIK